MAQLVDGTNLLITGASGFVGRRLTALVPEATTLSTRSASTTWRGALDKKKWVVHLAARVHQVHDTAMSPFAEYQRINVDGTLELARQSAAIGVKRFVFLSSVKVNGESTPPRKSFSETDAPVATDPYGISKWNAELGLLEIARQTGMEVVIIRPPLVYGPGVKANFASLIRVVAKRWPLPLASVDNRRSMVALDNLIDFIITCIQHPNASNQTFFVSDGDDQSTPDLIRGLAKALDVAPNMFAFPVPALQTIVALLGKRMAIERLCGNLQVDISKAKRLLQWSPPISVEEGLRRAARKHVER